MSSKGDNSVGESKKSKKQKSDKEAAKGTKRPANSDKHETVEVHSANNWEKVDMGGDDRKNKFLRLMGASKKEHHGRFVIGDGRASHGRSEQETQKLSDDLEDQYKQGMGLVLSGAARRHKGLGFQESDDGDQVQDNSSEAKEIQPVEVEKPEEEEEQPPKKKKKKSKKEKDSNGEKDEAKSDSTQDKAKSKPMLGFVKSSSSS